MSVNLCIDWGNTNVKAAVFADGVILKNVQLNVKHLLDQVVALIDTHKPTKAILSSVVEGTEELETLLRSKIGKFVKLNGNSIVPINNAYASPESLGPDRLALVTGAYMLHPDKNNLVISLGTCVTYSFITKTKTFRGGAICPGMEMRLKAMHEYTGKLPLVAVDGDLVLLGYDTETGIRSGAINGMAAEIDGMIADYEKGYSDFNAILTGGDASFFADKIKSKIFADPDLLLKGLNIIIDHNA